MVSSETQRADEMAEALKTLDERIMSVCLVIAQPNTHYARRLTKITELQKLVGLHDQLVKFEAKRALDRDDLLTEVRRWSVCVACEMTPGQQCEECGRSGKAA